MKGNEASFIQVLALIPSLNDVLEQSKARDRDKSRVIVHLVRAI